MFLTDNAWFPSFSPFKKHPKDLPNKFDLLSQSFDESLLRRIKALNPPSVTLSWLSQAVEFLCFAHAQADALISSLKVSSYDESLSSYLDNCLKVLDVCNSVLVQIERLKQRRLRVNFLPQLLASDLAKAKDFLSRWEIYDSSSSFQVKKRGFQRDVHDLVRDLAISLDNPPREKKTTTDGRLVRRTIHAVGLLTVFVADASISMLTGSTGLVEVVRAIPAEFAWADSFNELASTVSTQLKQRKDRDKIKGYFGEIDEVESRIIEVNDLIDSDDKEKLSGTVKELEKVAGSFSEELERFSNGVNGMFNRILSSRNGILDGMRLGQQKQKDEAKTIPKIFPVNANGKV
ncbi:hypothetical protein SLEP1_g38074 [Rubroshorea leprosula]|uniref:Uncharacterized protein n=1 Tax=Rubroshorea leprosula TaxID=152421 RepID=A0AAV5KXC5_9ROSI|nr:hypothetical protein SLEP1_g38074 [Rubroshorea leprosula]